MFTFTDIASYTYNSDKHNPLPHSLAYTIIFLQQFVFYDTHPFTHSDILSSV
jgi:hypothetical protein